MKTHPCRLCDRPLEHTFIDLGASPLSNSYLREEDLFRMEPFYSLRVFICSNCLLVQLPELERAENIFGGEYLYFSSYSQSWLEHCRAYAATATERFALDADSLVVEVASNDGYLLQFFAERNIPVLGIEPASNVADVAVREKGIPTEVAFFGAELADRLRRQRGKADLIIANNVLAHVPDLHDFISGLKQLLATDGVITVEFPHLAKMLSENQYDTIYHEHFSYFSLLTARRAFAAHDLVVFDVDELPTHGGSLRLYVCHQGSHAHPIKEAVGALEQRERSAGLESLHHYLAFEGQVSAVKCAFLEFLICARREGKTVVGYGAPAKGNTLLNYCGVRSDMVRFTVDKSPHKQNRFLPGSRIPILPPDAIDAARPDYVIILPWNLRDEILAQLSHTRSWGCRFVLPIPSFQVLE